VTVVGAHLVAGEVAGEPAAQAQLEAGAVEAGGVVLEHPGHTSAQGQQADGVAGVFEHHTSCLDGPGLELRLRRWLAGDLASDEVRADHGHGAVLAADAAARDPLGLPLIVTGPRRELLAGSELPLEFAAPHGDMMLTGCFGLLRALRDCHHGLAAGSNL
jgi:uncharacterized protein (DUF1786 family)